MSQAIPAALAPLLGGNQTAARPNPSMLPLMRGPLVVGLLIVLVFFGIFGGWAAMAPLSSGAIASGVVSPDSSRKVIQHLEGGIISAIHVRDGQQVKAGDALVTLQSTRQEASLSAGRERWLTLLVIRARLQAHMSGAEEMSLPPELEVEAASNPVLQTAIESQRLQFATERRAQLQIVEIRSRQVRQLESEIVSINAETVGLQTQKTLLDAQLVDAEKLLAQQLISRNQVSGMQSEQARLISAIASNDGRLARAEQSIEESKLTLLQDQEAFRIKTSEENTQVNAEISTIDAEVRNWSDVLDRTEIRSPVDGVVLNVRNQTIGGIVKPGDALLDIVPLNDDMIVLAKLSPRDIDLVTIGLQARVSLLPFASRNLLPLNGEVIQIAADSSFDEMTRQYYYEIRIRVPASELAKHEGLYMSPGMPADVTVVTGARTMLQYLAEPLLRAVRNAFVYD